MGTTTLEGVSASPSYWKRFLKIALGVLGVPAILILIFATAHTLLSEPDSSTDPRCGVVELGGPCIPFEPVE